MPLTGHVVIGVMLSQSYTMSTPGKHRLSCKNANIQTEVVSKIVVSENMFCLVSLLCSGAWSKKNAVVIIIFCCIFK